MEKLEIFSELTVTRSVSEEMRSVLAYASGYDANRQTVPLPTPGVGAGHPRDMAHKVFRELGLKLPDIEIAAY